MFYKSLPVLLMFVFGFACGIINDPNCGTKSNISPRIIGGTAALKSDWPWHAALISFSSRDNFIVCGAALITHRWLITAAHCIPKMLSKSFVNLGSNELNVMKYAYAIRRFIVHPEYDEVNVKNDIALIETREKIIFSNLIHPICVIENDSAIVSNKSSVAIVTGFGLTFGSIMDSVNGKPITSAVLMQVEVPLIDRRKCACQWKQMTGGQTEIAAEQICAGSFLRGTAPGDSGGPLQIKASNNRYYLIGVTSFGADLLEGVLNQEHYPGVYTRISSYNSWIDSETRNFASNGCLKSRFPCSFLRLISAYFLAIQLWSLRSCES